MVSKYGWDYKKENDDIFTKRSEEDKWLTPKGEALAAIKQKLSREEGFEASQDKSDYVSNVQRLIDKSL